MNVQTSVKTCDMAGRTMANAIRALAMDAVQAANSGHPGMPMGMADVAAVLFDRFVTDQMARFAAAGWHTVSCDAHEPEEIAAAIEAARKDPRPSLVACRSVIGWGAPNKQGGADCHGAPLGADEIAAARLHLEWPHEPFVIEPAAYAHWRAIAARGAAARADWQRRHDASPLVAELDSAQARGGLDALRAAMAEHKAKLIAERPRVATRKASEMALAVVNAVLPDTIGGSADLTGSNLTRTKDMRPVTRSDYGGRYIHYGIREHGMAAAMNGIALHGGFRAYGGTFLAFADYSRPAIRLSALMGVPVTHVMTHDSIGLGEDGPTHQPVEHLASLRAIPNLTVIRPADAVETAEAWEIAMAATAGPVLLALSRQNLPCIREAAAGNLSARGGYLLRDPGPRDVTLIATGSEVEIALAAADLLAADGIAAAVVSAPSFELFAGQPDEYRAQVLGVAPRVGIEAAIRQGWDGPVLRTTDGFIGMTGFGASAPAPDLYRHFGITAEAVAACARNLIEE
ncbi:hypothetical protein GI374_12285 [Paracoccus sp. S-4012]|uniref:transketolase-like TK C-terminal-containing protein n=1 Tax=Paracoccus sp. S-4012 TaxID=2665648 RepID=UPI0012B11482|nr:transketolase C-terminal domain-containing protein [Paracoccus sp. S-4012]MRX51210.1 hypothetical protein [Paracoccus sp. S-4012]